MTLPLVADGYGLDRALGALFWGAKQGETVSVMSARARVQGHWTGCVLCWLLNYLVERDHCGKALATGDVPTARPASYRAGGLLVLYAAFVIGVPYLIFALVF